MSQDKNIERFENLLRSTERYNIEALISFIRKSDFYTAPASTKYHSCHEGGLLEHTLHVYDCLKEKTKTYPYDQYDFQDRNLIIAALLHDICKTYFYDIEYKNKKVYSETGAKSDSNGRFDWVTVPGYTVNDRFPYGHGEKSVMIAESYIQLEPVEKYAIRWHMGFTEPKESWNTLSAAIRKYPLVLALHTADLEATYLLEEEE